MKPIGYARSRDYWTRFGWGTLMGLIGAVFAFVYIVMVHGIEQLPREVLRTNLFSSVAGAFGLLIGLLGMAMPLTLFLGSEGLLEVVEIRTELGTGFLLLSVLLKIVALTVALAAGFIGGPIFPLFFVGGTMGVVLWQIFPGIPLMMAAGCLMAAVPCAVVPLPVTLAVVVLLIKGTPVVNAIPMLTAALTAHFVFKGLVLSNPAVAGQRFRDIDAALQEAEDVQPEALV